MKYQVFAAIVLILSAPIVLAQSEIVLPETPPSVTLDGSSSYHLVRRDVSRCLEIGGDENGKLNDARLYQADCTGGTPQQFSAVIADSNYDFEWYQIMSNQSGRCLSNRGALAKVNITASDCKDDGSTLWRPEKVNDSGDVKLISKNSGLCLEIASDGNAVGALLQQSPCANIPKQTFSPMTRRETAKTLSPVAAHYLRNTSTNTCLGLQSSYVPPATLDSTTPEPVHPGVQDGAKADHAVCEFTPMQAFQFVPVGEGGWFYVRNTFSRKCLENGGGQELLQKTCDASDKQLWRLDVRGVLNNRMVSKVGGVCMATRPSSSDIFLEACSDPTSQSQQWELNDLRRLPIGAEDVQ